MSCSSPLDLGYQGCMAHAHGDHAGEKVALLAQLKLPLATSSNTSLPTRESSSLLLMHSHVLLVEERMSHGASTGEMEHSARLAPKPQAQPWKLDQGAPQLSLGSRLVLQRHSKRRFGDRLPVILGSHPW
jgi:hypothetical protein